MTHVFEFDVFLSHSIRDKDTVRDLADRLQKDGLRVWLDEWEIQPGDSVPLAIERGLESSRTLILVMSEHSVGRSSPSDWVTFERHASLFRDPTNQKRRFIPVRIDDVSVSDALGQFAYVDWRRKDESQYAKLLTLCRRQRSGDVCGSPDIATFDIRSISDEGNDPRSKYIALMRLRCGRYERSFQGSPMNEVTASTHVIQWLGERTTADRTGAQEVRQRKKHDDIRLEERHTFHDILKRRGKIVVIGRAGRGKTSLLYWAALRALDALEVSPEARVPIYVPLKELAQTRSVEDFRVARVCRKPLTRSFVEETMGWMANSTGRILPTVGTAKWLSDLQQWDLLVEQRLDGVQLYDFSIPGLDEYFAARHMAHRWIEGDAAYRSWLPSGRGWWWRHGRIRCPNPLCRQQLPLFRETLQWVEHKNAALMMVGMLRQSQAEELLLQGVPDVSLQLMCLSRCRSTHAEVSSRLRQLLHGRRLGRLMLRLTLWLTAPVWVPVILIYFLALRTGEGLALLMLAGLAGAVFVTGKILSLMDISSLWARVPLFVVLSLVLWVFGVVLVALLPELLWWGGLTAIRNLRKSLHSLAPWLTGLSERACPTKQPTQEALRAIGSARLPVNRDAVIDVYLSATSSRSAAIRAFAVEALGGIGHSRGTDAIIASLRDRAGFVRGRGVQALVELDDERAFEAMKTFLGSRGMPEYDQDLSEELARAIRGKQDSRAIPALVVALNGDSGGLWVIRDALKEFGEYAVPALCEVLHKPDSAAAQQAVKVLVEIGKPAEEPLTAMLTSANWRLRKVAAESLGRLRVPTAIEPLLSRLNDAHPDVGVAAAQALGRIGNDRAVNGLQNALESGGSSLAAAAVGALFAIKGPEVVLELEIQKTAVREATIAAVVTKIDGAPLQPVVASLTNLGEMVQERIFAAMRPLVCSTIETQMKQSDVAWGLSSEKFPESAVPLASGALERLVDALREDSVEVRRGMVSVIVAAGRIERWNGDVRRFLRRALVDPDIRTRAAILLCLKRLNRLWALWLYLCKDRKKVLSEIEHLESC